MIVEFVVNAGQQRILVNVRPSSFSVAIDVSTVYNFDAAGRLLGAYRQGRNYLRGLDNRILVKWGAGHGLARRSRLDMDEPGKRAFLDEMAEQMSAIAAAARTGEARPIGDTPGEDLAAAAHTLGGVLGYEALQADARRFAEIYKPISILPPDQYLALVVQATEGCSWNQCTFCDFYRDRRFRIKGPAEFRRHLRAALAFFGSALALRRSVFLADANALVIAQGRLLGLLDIVNEEIELEPAGLAAAERRAWLRAHPQALRGVYSFVDAFTTRHKTADNYRQMAARGLRRVYLGLESGDDDLLRLLNKGSACTDALRAVRTIKAGGVDVGVILMLGVGGQRFSAAHVRRSIEALNAMLLGERDIIYFSPFFDYAGSAYSRQAEEMGIEPLSAAAMDEQMTAIRAGLRLDAQHPPKIAVYDIREFIY